MQISFIPDNPFGKDGIFVQVAERVPFLNNGIQAIHKSQGELSALERARSRNPLGSDGVVTQIGELIPLVCDGIEAIHRMNGEELAAERARARTLPQLFSKDGTVTKFAELIPGTNIIAAMLHDMQGNHAEAMRAFDLYENWSNVVDCDGPLAKMAELVPGMDVVAFGIHVSNGHYPQALRSITKTKWVQVEFRSVSLWVSCGTLNNIDVTESRVRNVEVSPQVMSLIVGMNNLVTSYLKLDKSGNLRQTSPGYLSGEDLAPLTPRTFRCRRRRSSSRYLTDEDLEPLSPRTSEEQLSPLSPRDVDDEFAISGVETQALVCNFFQNIITRSVKSMEEDIPLYAKWSLDMVNELTIPRWRREKWRYYMLFKRKALPMLPQSLTETLQQAFPRCSMTHEPLALAKHRVVLPPLKLTAKNRNYPEAALAMGAMGAAGICSGKVAALACFGGVLAGTTVLCRSAFRYLYNHFNNYNIEAWEPAALRLESDRPEKRRLEPKAVMLELEKSDAARIIDLAVNHIVENVRGGCLAAPIFRFAKPFLQALVRCCGPEWETVPFVMDIDIGDLVIELDGWPDGLRIPNLRLALLFDINLVGNELSKVRAVIPDSLVDEMFDSLRLQVQDLDMRTFDPRLAGFTQPLRLNFDMNIRWTSANDVEFNFTKVRSTLHLPD
jgi:hypothetical protein